MILPTKKGNTLIEVMLGIAIAVVGLLAIVQLSSRSVSNSGFAKRKSEATALATKASECMRNLRSVNGWSTFRTYTASSGPIAGCCTSTAEFTCSIPAFVSTNNPQQIELEILVTWGAGFANNEFVRQRTIFAGY